MRSILQFSNNKCRLLTLVISLAGILSLGSCSMEPAKHLEPYLKTLPAEEAINASLYHYELLTEQAKANFLAKDYLEVLSLYKTYLNVFYEADVSNKNHLLYYTGMSIKRLCEAGRPEAAFLTLTGESSQALASIGVSWTSNERSQTLKYNNVHLQEILENRLDYILEWNVLREYYLTNFIFAPQTTKEHASNFAYLYYLVTHFPNMVEYMPLLYNPSIINANFFSRNEQKKFAYIRSLLTLYPHTQDQTNGAGSLGEPIVVFAQTGGLVIRSRSNLISSRNFLKLEAWEPLWLNRKVQGEDGHAWWEVSLKGNKVLPDMLTPVGYIPTENGLLNDVDTLAGAAVNLTLTAQDLAASFTTFKLAQLQSFEHNYYLEAVQAYYNRDYLAAVEILAKLLPETEGKTRERTITLFYKTLLAIAARSTSLNNPYTQFVKKHPLYFTSYTHPPHPPELKVSDKWLTMLIAVNPQSVMLQYYK